MTILSDVSKMSDVDLIRAVRELTRTELPDWEIIDELIDEIEKRTWRREVVVRTLQ